MTERKCVGEIDAKVRGLLRKMLRKVSPNHKHWLTINHELYRTVDAAGRSRIKSIIDLHLCQTMLNHK